MWPTGGKGRTVEVDVRNVPLDTTYKSFRGRFYGSVDATNSVIALKDTG